MNNKLLKGDEVATILNISRSQAFSLMGRGDIPTVRFGKLVRVRPEDLAQFIESNRTGNDQSYQKTKPAVAAASLAPTLVNPIKKGVHSCLV